MLKEFTAIIKQTDSCWFGWIEEIPGVNCQENTKQDLVNSLRETLKEALEYNKQDAISYAGNNYLEEKIAIQDEKKTTNKIPSQEWLCPYQRRQ